MIRPATLEDVATLVELGAHMHAESPNWSRLTYSRELVEATIRTLIESPDGFAYVAERNGRVVGGALAQIATHWCTSDRIAGELALFIEPEERGGLSAIKLIAAMQNWSERRQARTLMAGSSTEIDVERCAQLYESLGFRRLDGVTLEYP